MEMKEYFSSGDIVVVRQEIAHKPKMVVDGEVRSSADPGGNGKLLGIKTWWFDTHGIKQEAIFNTKDIKLA